ncbi:hypothetical protein CARUB_v100126091mg, partial [Capsella rubella]
KPKSSCIIIEDA